MLGALRSLGERWAVAQNAVHYLRVIAETVFSRRDDTDVMLYNDSTLHENDSGIGADFGNLSWFDLFSPDQLQGALLDS